MHIQLLNWRRNTVPLSMYYVYVSIHYVYVSTLYSATNTHVCIRIWFKIQSGLNRKHWEGKTRF